MSHPDLFEPAVAGDGVGHLGLHVREASGAFRLATADEVVVAAREALVRKYRRGSAFTSPEVVKAYLRAHLADRAHEVFAVLFLDTRHRLIEYVELFRGSIDGASVYPREVVKEALSRNAAAVILAHNHPSGITEPSQADRLITRRLQDALTLVEVRVLDHLIVGGDDVLSFAERGLL